MSATKRPWRVLRKGVRIFLRWWIGESDPEDPATPRGLIKFLHAIGPQFLEAVVFGSAAWRVLKSYACSDGLSIGEWLACKEPGLLPFCLILLVGVIFHLGRISVDRELSITNKIFSESRVPTDWVGKNDVLVITVQVLAFFVSYSAIAWFADKLVVVSTLLFVIACFDWNTRRMINHRVKVYFANSRYMPALDDSHYQAITQSRDVIRRYLYDLPHLWKETGKAAGCAVSLGWAIAWQLSGSAWTRSVSYLILITTLIVNEIFTTFIWRRKRDRELEEIAS